MEDKTILHIDHKVIKHVIPFEFNETQFREIFLSVKKTNDIIDNEVKEIEDEILNRKTELDAINIDDKKNRRIKQKEINLLYEKRNKVNNKKKWIIQKSKGRHVFPHINKLITDYDNISLIGVNLELNLNNTECMDLGIYENDNCFRSLYKGKHDSKDKSKIIKFNEVLFKYSSVNVYLFETGVGFLVYGLKFYNLENVDELSKRVSNDKLSIDDVINSNYIFKKYDIKEGIYEDYSWEIMHEKLKFKDYVSGESEKKDHKYQKHLEKINKLEYLNSKANYGTKRTTWIDMILNSLKVKRINTLTDLNSSFITNVFTYINIKEEIEEDTIKQYMFYLKNIFKKTNKLRDSFIADNSNNKILNTFEDINWGASIEGVACLSQYTSDSETNIFIDAFKSNVEITYFNMYILMLHMRYALLKYITEAADLEKEDKVCDGKYLNSVSELRKKIIFLNLRAIFNDISNVTAHVEFLDLMRETLRIDKLTDELDKEIVNLGNVAEFSYQKQKDREEKRRSNSLEVIYFIIGGFSISSFVKDLLFAVPKFRYNNELYLALVFVGMATLFGVFRYIKNKKYK